MSFTFTAIRIPLPRLWKSAPTALGRGVRKWRNALFQCTVHYMQPSVVDAARFVREREGLLPGRAPAGRRNAVSSHKVARDPLIPTIFAIQAFPEI